MSLLYFYSPGTCALGGMVVLEWLSLPYSLCEVDRRTRASEAFKKVNPFGKVPALRAGDRFIVESSAIILHLINLKPQSGLSPEVGSAKWDEQNQWFSYLASGFHASFYPFFSPGRYILDDNLQPKIKEAALVQIRNQYEYVEKHLSENEWMLGKKKSVLDPRFYAMSRWGNNSFQMKEEFPNVYRHQKKLEEDPAIQFALAVEKGEVAKSPSGVFQGQIDLAKI